MKTSQKSFQNDANINIKFMKKTSFQKTLKVLKPLYLLCRMHIAEGSPTQKAIKKERKINAKIMLENCMRKT